MNVETTTKIKTLAEAQEALARIPNLHRGGCGIAALALSRWIKKSDMCASTLFVLGDDSGRYYKTNATAIIDHSIEPDSCAHIGIIVYDFETRRQHIIDAQGVYDMGKYSFINVMADEKLMLRSINRINRWNDSFDREYVKQIAETLDIDLSDVDCRTQRQYLNSKVAEKQTVEGYQSLLWEMLQPSSILMSM